MKKQNRILLKKVKLIFLNSIPILFMLFLIPIIKNDFILCLIFILLSFFSLFFHFEKNDFLFFIFGLIGMTISESLFLLTGVETFIRKSLFGIMPIWLPILWAYSFVVMKRSIKILES